MGGDWSSGGLASPTSAAKYHHAQCGQRLAVGCEQHRIDEAECVSLKTVEALSALGSCCRWQLGLLLLKDMCGHKVPAEAWRF